MPTPQCLLIKRTRDQVARDHAYVEAGSQCYICRIKNDKIGGKSIKMSANNTEITWTLALHHMLTNLNHLLAWVCTYAAQQDATSSEQE
jgi:hypothetical protein